MSIELNHTPYPAIEPVPKDTVRPFWSVMIPTYNCAELLRRTLRSVLAQDPGPEEMSIEVIDDRSSRDDPEAVVNEVGKGRVTFYRQPENVGAQANFTTCIQRARGEWVHILHGDDMVMPGYYRRLREAAEKEPSIEAAFCRYIYMDEDDHWQNISKLERRTPGILSDWLEAVAVVNPIMFPAISVKRSVYERIGGFHPILFHSADWDMWKRVYLNAVVWYEPEPLALYRVHSASDSSTLERTGANIADARMSIELSERYLPDGVAAEFSRKARYHLARGAVDAARRMITKGAGPEAAFAQLREGLKTSAAPGVAVEVGRLALWAGLVWGKRAVGSGRRRHPGGRSPGGSAGRERRAPLAQSDAASSDARATA